MKIEQSPDDESHHHSKQPARVSRPGVFVFHRSNTCNETSSIRIKAREKGKPPNSCDGRSST